MYEMYVRFLSLSMPTNFNPTLFDLLDAKVTHHVVCVTEHRHKQLFPLHLYAHLSGMREWVLRDPHVTVHDQIPNRERM